MTLEATLATIEKLQAQNAHLAHERDEYRKLYELVHTELERWRRHLFGRRAEQVDPAQMQMAIAAVAEQIAAAAAMVPGAAQAANDATAQEAAPAEEEKKKRTSHGRAKLPEHLPIERIVVDPPEKLRACGGCTGATIRIGEEVSERLDWRPSSLVRVQTVRGKYACECEQGGVVIAEMPDLPIEKGLPGPGLLAHVLVSKFCDHLPLHRLEDIFERHGVHISRSTMCGWTASSADLLAPIVEAAAKDMLSAACINTDDTGIPVLDAGKARRGFMWVYLSDNGHVVFRYTRTRSGQGPRDMLAGFKGYLQADAASLYDKLYDAPDGPTEVGCWAHCRRGFYDAQLTDPQRARVAIAFIAKLYEADHATRKLPPSTRGSRRRELALPVLVAMKAWLDVEKLAVLPKSPVGNAVGYARNQWIALTRFLEDGRLKLDNNASERTLRPIAIGRNNWTFAGNDDGARRAATFFSLIASCKLHHVNPWEYLRDVLVRVLSHPARDVLALTPREWANTKKRDTQLVASVPMAAAATG